jgi:hypothetical protein
VFSRRRNHGSLENVVSHLLNLSEDTIEIFFFLSRFSFRFHRLDRHVLHSHIAVAFILVVAMEGRDGCVSNGFRAVATVVAVPRSTSPVDLHVRALHSIFRSAILIAIIMVLSIHSRMVVMAIKFKNVTSRVSRHSLFASSIMAFAILASIATVVIAKSLRRAFKEAAVFVSARFTDFLFTRLSLAFFDRLIPRTFEGEFSLLLLLLFRFTLVLHFTGFHSFNDSGDL